MMNRIDKTLQSLQQQGKKILSPYITAGDPIMKDTASLMHALVNHGADIIELGLPFSDPMAEGPVIQAAMERALQEGIQCKQVLDMVRLFRKKDQSTPIILMGYLNPIEQYGYEAFAKDAVNAGVDGTILVDLPPEESQLIHEIWSHHGLYGIYLCSPTTTTERMHLINEIAQGYLYYVSLKGVTGANDINLTDISALYEKRKSQVTVPLMVGFGIKTPAIAAKIASFADGVIVGAALIDTMFLAHKANQNTMHAATSLIQAMRNAIDSENKND